MSAEQIARELSRDPSEPGTARLAEDLNDVEPFDPMTGPMDAGAGAPKTAAPASGTDECWCSCGRPHKGPNALAPACRDRGDMHIAAAKARALLALSDEQLCIARYACGTVTSTKLDTAEWAQCYAALNCASWAIEYANDALRKATGGVMVGAEVKWVAPTSGTKGGEA